MTKTYLAHYGIKGQRWGIRRFQNEDGSLTKKGQRRYNVNEDGTATVKKGFVTRNVIAGTLNAVSGTKSLVKAKKMFNENKKKTAITLTFDKKQNAFVAGRSSASDFFKNNKKAIFSTAIGAISVGLAVKNFVNSVSNRTLTGVPINSVKEIDKEKAEK